MDNRFIPGIFLENTERDFSINIDHIVSVDNVDGIAAIRLAGEKTSLSLGDSRKSFGQFSDVVQALKDTPVNGLLLIDGVRFYRLIPPDDGQTDGDRYSSIVGQSIINFRNINRICPYERADGVLLSAPETGNFSAVISIEKIGYKTLKTLRDQSLATAGLLVAPGRNELGYATSGTGEKSPQP